LIQSDGTYSLVTKRDGLQADGAVPGANRVIVQCGLQSTIYPAPYRVEARDNEFNLKIERSRR
jgi:hypothetical protein